MHLRLRFIGKALEYLNSKGHDDRRLTLQVNPEVVHVGDLIRHPLFPGRNVYVVAREVDFVDRCVNIWLDELPGTNPFEHDTVLDDSQLRSESPEDPVNEQRET